MRDLPDKIKEGKNVVIVGGGLAGMTLAMNLTRINRDLKITVIKKEREGSYSPCGMPFVLEGKVGMMEDIILHDTDFYEGKGIRLKTEEEVIKIDLERENVQLASNEIIEYDILVITTGRKPFIPPIEGIDLKGVYTLSNYDDGVKLNEAQKNARQAVIIGGGVIGLETAVAFMNNGIKTAVIEMLPSILPLMLDPDMASIVQKNLENSGMNIHCATRVQSIKGQKNVENIETDKGEFPADLVLIATGIRPNVDLAKNAGLTLGETGGIATDAKMHVKKDGKTLDNVYALGDCVEVKNWVTKTAQISALASTAALQTRIAAANICGGNAEVKGYLSPTITVIGDLQIGSVGLTSHNAEKNKIEIETRKVSGSTRSSYYPGRKEIHIKLLAHEERLVGAQLLSEEDVKERMNAITLAIQNKIRIDQLVLTERCFTPPLSLLTDPFIRALENF